MIRALLITSMVGLSAASFEANLTKAFSKAPKLGSTHCVARGGCDCDCSWASPTTCGSDDGSCCWGCCCSSPPTPGPAAPTPAPPGVTAYCPAAADLVSAYDGAQKMFDQGWSIHGAGGVATKAAFNLLGGSVEYDIDFSGVPIGVNANIYTISPSNIGSGYTPDNYCDGATNDRPWCVEVDWIESNGNCGGATTLHTVPGPGNDGCSAWGCRDSYHYNGRSTFHMKIEYGADGTWTTTRDGVVIYPGGMSPQPTANDWSVLKQQYSQFGAVIYSSQWTGWTPVDDCGGGGDLSSAQFAVKNLVVKGSVVQGPEPRKCP